LLIASYHHTVIEQWVVAWTWCSQVVLPCVMHRVSSFTTWVTCQPDRQMIVSASASFCMIRFLSSLMCRCQLNRSHDGDMALVFVLC